MLNLKETLSADIREGLAQAQKKGVLAVFKKEIEIVVEWKNSLEHGDYASPVALSLSKIIKKAPIEIAKAIADHMPAREYLGKVEVAGPGFLNMRLNPGWMTARLNNVIQEDLCADISVGRGKSVNLEFISANPNGPLTLANARTAFSADTLGNILSCAGYNVIREYYINDAGGQVRKLAQSVMRRALQASGQKVDFPEDLYQGEYINVVAARLNEKLAEDQGKEFSVDDLDNEAVLAWVSDEAVSFFLAEIKKTITEDLKIKFDVWTSEKQLRESGIVEKTLEKLRVKKETYQKEGAEFLRTNKYGDDQDRVLVKSDGQYAYIAPDIGYHQNKYDRGFDLIFTFLGADHQGHIPRLKAAMQALGNDVAKLHFKVAQWFRLVRGSEVVKVSKRAGNIVTPKDLIDEVGYDAARFFLVQHRLDTHMDFDLELAKEKSERNPVYYVQYAYVRLQSILRRAKEAGVLDQVSESLAKLNNPALTHTYELELMRQIYRFREVMTDMAKNFTVHDLTYYARDLARAVHVFYSQVPVLSADAKLVPGRVQLVMAAQTVLSKTLDLLGISKPNVM